MTGLLLARFDRIPNEQAIALAPRAGWTMLTLAVLAAVIFILNREGWRRAFLRAEDPRTMAVVRIAFAFCAMCNINGLWELYEYLFTDEGLFLGDVARQVFAREQFRGFGNGLGDDPYGFMDARGLWQFLKGPKYSLLFFWDTPLAFWLHWAAFQLAIVALMIGAATRYTKWIAWFLFHSIILRNSIFYEGTETVYRCFFFYLCLSRPGRAYSVDNWLRCRRLRKQNRLSERGGPGNGAGLAPNDDYPDGLEAIYRRIPAWPRLLIILQCGALYCYTGVVKNGAVWWRGDAMYYALNLDHFYRLPPQQLSAWLGTTVFRANTYITHFWESFFPLCVFGLFARYGLRERLPEPSRATRRLHLTAWLALSLTAAYLCYFLWPTHYAVRGQASGPWTFWQTGWWSLTRVQVGFTAAWWLVTAVIAAGWISLRKRPRTLEFRGHSIRVDLDFVLRWTTGRRIWVLLGFVFHLHAYVLMNIGWFQPGASVGFLAFVSGTEMALIGAVLGRTFARVPGLRRVIPKWVQAGEDPTPPEDPTLPHLHRDDYQLPVRVMVVALLAAIGGVFLDYYNLLAYGWTLLIVFYYLATEMMSDLANLSARTRRILKLLYALSGFSANINIGIAVGLPTLILAWLAWRARQHPAKPLDVVAPPGRDDPRLTSRQLTEPWAYGPIGRLLANCLVIYHVVGVACCLLPDKDSFRWREETHKPFKWWLRQTHTWQGWRMFAPNPPRGNRFLKVLVTDADGVVHDMQTDIYAKENRPIPWIWYTRQRKINRRIGGSEGGKGSWYQKWHARYYCREWQKHNNGELPKKVELVNVTYRITSPNYVHKNGPYDPWARLSSKGKEKVIYTATCKTEFGAQLVNEVRERHGLGPSPVKIRRWDQVRGRKKGWEKWQEKQRKKREKKQ